MPRSTSVTIAAILVAVFSVFAGVAAAVPTDTFHDLGCVSDPEGDVANPAGDLLNVCVNYQGALVVVWEVAAPVDPLTDPGWAQPGTVATVDLSIDSTNESEYAVTLRRDGATLRGALDPLGPGISCSADRAEFRADSYIVRIPDSCAVDLGSAVTVSATFAYQPDGSATSVVDRAPDGTGTLGPLSPEPPPPPQCAPVDDEGDDGQIVTIRVSCGAGETLPVNQAVAASQFAFGQPYSADWAVLARDDDFADALAGSALGFGQGPLLFTHSPASTPPGEVSGRLTEMTANELQRVLPKGRTVYVLGSSVALDNSIDDHLRELGFVPQRLAGPAREETAVAIADEALSRVAEFNRASGFPDIRSVIVATRGNWPDAVVAGSVAAYWGTPILLTPIDNLHAATEAALRRMQPEFIHVIGGDAVISEPVRAQLETLSTGSAAFDSFCQPFASEENTDTCRWGGINRVRTATLVGELNRRLLARHGQSPLDNIPPDVVYAAAVNLYREDAFNHALSATVLSGRYHGAAFIPLLGDDGNEIEDNARLWMCEYIPDLRFLLLIGGNDLVTDDAAAAVRDHLESGGCDS